MTVFLSCHDTATLCRFAVCGYSLEDIDASFDGDYLTFNAQGAQVSQPLSNKINVSFVF